METLTRKEAGASGTRGRILCIDDDPQITRLVDQCLSKEDFVVTAVHSAADAVAKFDLGFDLLILDLSLPDRDGFDLLRELRQTSTVPVIMLTGKADPIDMIVGLELGADDYVTKPFDGRELVARIRSVLRRVAAHPDHAVADSWEEDVGTKVQFDVWTLDLDRQILNRDSGEEVLLTNREFDLLESLVLSHGRVQTRDMLMDKIAGLDWVPSDRRIDVLVARIRKKLGDDPKANRLIKTVRGKGYRFIAPVKKTASRVTS